MTTQFNETITKTADDLIEMSTLLENKMETWAEVFTRHPDAQNVGNCAGFISDQTAENRLEVLVDVLTLPDTDTGEIRVRAIETTHDEDNNERFNAVSLHYTVDRAAARQLVEKEGAITRDDIAKLLHADTSALDNLTISDQTGRDEETQQLLGKRYDLDADELKAVPEATETGLTEALHTVLARLKRTAAGEASA